MTDVDHGKQSERNRSMIRGVGREIADVDGNVERHNQEPTR